MTRDEIYDHLAQVYLGKREKGEDKKRKEFNAWLVINIVIIAMILTSTVYGLTAFLTKQKDDLHSKVFYALHNGPIRVKYNLNEPYPQVESFTLTIPQMDFSKYEKLSFSIRGLEEGQPGIVKVVIRNTKNETSSFFIQNVRLKWNKFDISFNDFPEITDWGTLTDLSFVFEAWNAEKKRGVVLIDNICFSS